MVRWLVFVVAAGSLLSTSCKRQTVGSDPSDGSTPIPDAAVPPADASAPGCGPQDAYEHPNVVCESCAYCYDLIPWRWTGDRCSFEPICCECLGADCPNRYRTFDECEAARDFCEHALLEVEYPDARLIFHMPGGAAGHGPMIDVNGFGELQTWQYVHDLWNPGPPDHAESIGFEQAGALFRRLEAVNFAGLPHTTMYSECYPQLWLWWEQGPAYDPMVLDYPRAQSLLPELEFVYEWFDRFLCRGDPDEGYPMTLPSAYCEFLF